MIWKCKDKNIEYGKKILLMGIVNVTPDSFSDGGKYLCEEDAIKHALDLVREGADIIDIGAQSTRPGYEQITPEEEWERIKNVIIGIRNATNIPISIDTYYPKVAQNALNLGANIINDISGNVCQDMAKVVKEAKSGWIITYNGPGNISETKGFFLQKVKQIEDFGIEKPQICFDMGIGFGKTREDDMKLISNVKEYKIKEYPLLLGTSRKRVIKEGSGQENPEERIYGNIAADTAAIFGGVDIIRLHDIKNEKQGILMASALKENING